MNFGDLLNQEVCDMNGLEVSNVSDKLGQSIHLFVNFIYRKPGAVFEEM